MGVIPSLSPSTLSREILYTSAVFYMAVLPTREMLGLSNPGRVLGQAAGQGGSSQNSASVTGCAAAARGIVFSLKIHVCRTES